MKKIIIIMGVITTVLTLTTVSVSAKNLYPEWVKGEMRSGRSAEDACGAMAIMVLGGDNVSAFIYQKHRELGDWEKTAEYYGVNIEEFNNNINNYIKEVPDNVYNEMIASGMTDDDCYDFARRTSNVQMDIKVTWEAKKNGKTINVLIKEETARKNAELQAATDFAFGKITEKEFTEKMKSLSPEMSLSDILSFAMEEKRGWMEFRRATSGITDDELEAAYEAGVTDFFVACRLKDAEQITNKTFSDMIRQVGAGKDADEVIKENISTEKIAAGREKSRASEEQTVRNVADEDK